MSVTQSVNGVNNPGAGVALTGSSSKPPPGGVAPGKGLAGSLPGGAAQVPALGLSYSAYLTAREIEVPPFNVTAYSGGRLIQFTPAYRSISDREERLKGGGGRRGEVTGFSKSSRRRLMQEFNKLDELQVSTAYFATLTYPEHFPAVSITKRHLDRLGKRFRRRWPAAAVIWRLEPQSRGAPHYHLFIVGLPVPSDMSPRQFIREMRYWLKVAWCQIVGAQGIELVKHFKAGTQFDQVKSVRHAQSYIGKYLSKDEHELQDVSPGRFWGVWGPIEDYYGKVVRLVLSGPAAASVFRLLDRGKLASARARRRPGARARAIVYARKRRYDFEGRWYVCSVNQVVRYFLQLGPPG